MRKDPGLLDLTAEIRGASARATLISGVFGDPTLLLRLDHRRRCFFFDIGDLSPVPTKIINETTDIFISHAHLDHFGGFPLLLRKRIGNTDPLRIYGPPGISQRVRAMIDGFTWDRIEDRGPRFHIHEYDGEQRTVFETVVGHPGVGKLGCSPVYDQALLEEPRFVVRSTVLDHGIPVLAFALEESGRFNTRPERLEARSLEPGDWLGDLKSLAATRQWDSVYELPDGSRETVETLAAELFLEEPGQKIVYATDFANTPQNRERVVALARDADIFICEASFLSEDADQADRTGHLTATATAEIALEANVRRLLPFHFSSRYDREPERVLDEIRTAAPELELLLDIDD